MRKIKMTCDRCNILELYDNSDDAYDAGSEHQDEHGLEEILITWIGVGVAPFPVLPLRYAWG